MMEFKKMKKITVIHPLDDSYGATKILSYVISILSNFFFIEVWFKTDKVYLESFLSQLPCKSDNITYLKVKSIPVVHSKIFSIKGLVSLLMDFLQFSFFLMNKRNSSGLIYINTYAAGLTSLACRVFLIKNIVHCHENQKNKFSGRALASMIRMSANEIICVSQVVRDYVSGGKENVRTTIIRNGISDIFDNVISDKVIDRENPKFLIVGRVMPEKGYWFLADAVKIVKEKFNISLVIDAYGDAPPNRPTLLENYRDYLKRNDIVENIRLLGFNGRAEYEMLNYDVVLVPSIMSDPFPTTVLEGMRAGCVVVTTSHGGAAEIIQEMHNGLLIEKDDVESFAALLKNIYLNNVDTGNIAIRARDYYENNLTKAVFEKNIVQCIQNFIQD